MSLTLATTSAARPSRRTAGTFSIRTCWIGATRPSQAFYAGVSRSREIDHDSNLYATYRQEEARLRDEHGGLDIRRVILEQDLKREYQEFLQEHNRNRSDSDGRPDRDEDEIRDWAREHDLPYFDGQVHFPDYRIEYEVDGRERHEDVELFTPHYRGAHAASRAKTGFRIYVVGIPRWRRSFRGRIRASWRNSCDARIPAQSDVRQRQLSAG